MYKKCKVVMLRADKGRSDLMLMHNKSQGLMLLKTATELDGKFQHLYILSDDEIKEGDWYLANFTHLYQHKKGEPVLGITAYKIIATTDSSFKTYMPGQRIEATPELTFKYLPSIPQSFIDKYISEYNKGNMISEVMVEYTQGDFTIRRPKLNPDNTINIKSIKDSWSREEVIEIIKKFELSGFYSFTSTNKFNEWIETNL